MQMGTTKYETICKQIRFRYIYVEFIGSTGQKTISLMTDTIIDVSVLKFDSKFEFQTSMT